MGGFVAPLSHRMPMAICIWTLEVEEIVEHMCPPIVPIAKSLSFFMIETLPQEGFLKGVVTLWAIWTMRWKAMH
jgi:hypothetical protein